MATTALSLSSKTSQSPRFKNTLTLIDLEFKRQLDEKLEEFDLHLLTMKGLVKGTISNHIKVIRKMLFWIGTLEPTHVQMQKHVAWMHEKKYSYSHRVNTIRAIEAFSEFIGNPIKLGRPKKPKQIVKNGLTEGEVVKIVDACKNIREKAIIAVLAYSGIRNNELCSLKVKELDLGNNYIKIIGGKGAKDRTACISGDCTRILLDYLNDYPRDGESFLFTNLRNDGQYQPYSCRALVKAVVKRTDIKKRVHPHLFRHTLACNMYARGANLLTIKDQLGHEFIETTMIYVKSSPRRVAAEYHIFAPSYV